MLKWTGRAREGAPPLGPGTFRIGDPANRVVGRHRTDRALEVLVEGPTRFFDRLQAHATTLEKGAGYDEHRDDYDVAIVVLEGTIETLDRRLGPRGVAFCAAGRPHGMRNVGDGRARYLVFELDGGTFEPELRTRPNRRRGLRRTLRRLARRATGPLARVYRVFFPRA
jgi:quercetin dioxygenase-like cupin family protein